MPITSHNIAKGYARFKKRLGRDSRYVERSEAVPKPTFPAIARARSAAMYGTSAQPIPVKMFHATHVRMIRSHEYCDMLGRVSNEDGPAASRTICVEEGLLMS